MKNLTNMCCCPIECYCRGSKPRLHKMLGLYNPSNKKQCVYGIEISQNGIYPLKCCMPVGPNDVFAIARNINAHQIRIPEAILEAFAAAAVGFKPAKDFSNFDKYFDYVANEAEKSGVLKNGKCLLVYDYCLRTGYSTGPQPKDYVYLFCGAREGAKAVLPPSALAGKFRVQTTMLHAALGTTCLSSMEIEDFLCVCEVPLKYLTTIGAGVACPSGGCGKGSGK